MTLPLNKTKIVCTIGPASESPAVLERMIAAGMNVARINFSHGEFADHKRIISGVRKAASAAGHRVAIMADFPGPKIRIGRLAAEPIQVTLGDELTLTSDDTLGDGRRVSVTLPRLPQVVKSGDTLFLNDGLIELEVLNVEGNDLHCRVLAGGELRSRKGLNVPGIDLGISAFTDRDRECLKFSLDEGVDVVSQSFVQSAEDILAVREAAAACGHNPFIIAKIERSTALNHVDEILHAADGIMIARGDLGVEIPIETIALVQKELMRKANLLAKPVITATQMLESMTDHRRPTRAESTDVANAILDGTDCVMLSGESAMGNYPVESVAMLSKIAATVEPAIQSTAAHEALTSHVKDEHLRIADLIALSVAAVVERAAPAAVFVPTRSGATARSIARFRLPVWIIGVSRRENTCQRLQFSYGVFPTLVTDHPEDWNQYTREWLHSQSMQGDLVVLTEGPSTKHPVGNNRMEIIDLRRYRRPSA